MESEIVTIILGRRTAEDLAIALSLALGGVPDGPGKGREDLPTYLPLDADAPAK